MSWRLAESLAILRDEVNARWPDRSKVSDGTVGDLRHQQEKGGSDHNPNAAGVVRAFDCTANVGDTNPANVDGEWLFQHVIALGRAGHRALGNHGYVIFNARAAYASNGWKVVPYHGVSPHREHVHISVGRAPAQYDSHDPWAIDIPDKPKPPVEDDVTDADKNEIILKTAAAVERVLKDDFARLEAKVDALAKKVK